MKFIYCFTVLGLLSSSIFAQDLAEKGILLSDEEMKISPDYYLLNPDDVGNLNEEGQIRLYQYIVEEGEYKREEKWVERGEVRKLYVSYTDDKLGEFPKEVFEFENIQTLVMASWQFESIPWDLAVKLPNIQYLDIQGAKVRTLPDNFSDLKHLKYLNLSGTLISEMTKNALREMLPKVTFF